MKQGKTLQELAVEIMRQSEAKKDYVLNTSNLEMQNDDNKFSFLFSNGDIKMPEMNQNCHNQVGTHLGIPKKYYDKMMVEQPDLLVHNVNTWFNHNPTNRMVRTLDNTARAFLSDRYRCLDNDEILSMALNAIKEVNGGIRIASCDVTERKLYLKCTFPSNIVEVKKGDPVCAGFIISNSEIGLGALVGQFFIERLVCTNGMIVPEYSMRKNHIGRALGTNEVDGAITYYKDDTLAADDKALILRLRDTITSFSDIAQLTAVVGKLQETTERKLTDPIHAVEEVSKKFQFNNNEKTSVLMNLIQGGDLSQYGIINAVTRTAEDIQDYDRATEFEKMGGEIIDLKPNEWKVIAEKAA